jgi:hypothetical protein
VSLSLFFLPLYCESIFDLQIWITPFVASKLSHRKKELGNQKSVMRLTCLYDYKTKQRIEKKTKTRQKQKKKSPKKINKHNKLNQDITNKQAKKKKNS